MRDYRIEVLVIAIAVGLLVFLGMPSDTNELLTPIEAEEISLPPWTETGLVAHAGGILTLANGETANYTNALEAVL